jgi:hypothetical protein
MSGIRTFSGVTTEILRRMQELTRASYGVVYDPPEGSSGTATSQTPLGQFVVEFALDNQKDELTLTLVKKPPLLPDELLWSGFVTTLDSCREPSSPSSSESRSPSALCAAPDSIIEAERQFDEASSQPVNIDAAAASPNADVSEVAMRSISATQDAAEMRPAHETKVEQSAGQAGPKALDTISHVTYSGSYALAYGIVYATMFIVQSLPQNNAIMNGLYDGGRAAMKGLREGEADGMRDCGTIRSD